MPNSKTETPRALSCLPSELLCYIARFLSACDALSLAATNQRHHAVLTDHIYKDEVRQDCGAISALIWAAARGSVATARRCLEAGADPDQQCDWMGEVVSRGDGGNQHHHGAISPLMCAVKNGHQDVVRLLLQFGADPCGPVDFTTPVSIAVDRGETEMVRLMLLTAGPGNPSPARKIARTRCPRGSTPLNHSARWGRDEIVRLLLEHGGQGPDGSTLLELRDAYGYTALMDAICGGRHSTARILLDAGADVWALDRRRRDCIEQARDVAILAGPAGKATLDVLFAPLRRSRVVTVAGGKTVRERYIAMPHDRVCGLLTCGVPGVVEAVLETGGAADSMPVPTSSTGVTPLWHYAGATRLVALPFKSDVIPGPARRVSSEERDLIQQRRRDIIGMLIDHGADIHFRDGESGMTPLMRAAKAGFADVVHLLLERGASVEIADMEGLTALEHADGDECKQRLLQALGVVPKSETNGMAGL